MADVYEPLGGTLVRTDVASAEMIKLASNAFLATKISFINEIANVCEEVGADVTEVAGGMGLDDRIGPKFLRAGIGWGGSCFRKDTIALKKLAGNTGYHFQLLSAVIDVNELQKRRVVGKLKQHLGSLAGRRIALSGSRSSRTPTTCATRRASCWPRACRARGPRSAPTTRSPSSGRASCCPTSKSATHPRPRWRAPTRRSWSRNGRSSPSSTGRSRRDGWRTRCWWTAATSSIRRVCAPRASPTRASAGRPTAGGGGA